jgi:hypothetical protein
MPVKFEMLMQGFGQSWSEAHYFLPSDSLQAALAYSNVIAGARANCLGLGATVTAVRASAVPGNRETASFNNQGQGWAPQAVADAAHNVWQATLPNVALLIRFYSTSGGFYPPKSLNLASPPTIAVQAGANQNLDDNLVANGGAAFLLALKYYLLNLTGYFPPSVATQQSVWGYRARDESGFEPAQGVVASAGAPAMVGIQTTSPLIGVTAGGRVYVKGFRRLNDESPGLNGNWRVATFVPSNPPTVPYNTYYFLNSGGVSPTNFTTYGIIMPEEYVYVPYDPNYDIVKAVTRKRGGSIGLRRGRSRTR